MKTAKKVTWTHTHTIYVPYTGATGAVDLGSENLTTLGLGTFGGLTDTTINDTHVVFSDSNRLKGSAGLTYDTVNTRLRIFGGSSGATAHTYSRLIIEHNTHEALQFLGPNNRLQYIMFGDPQDNFNGGIYYTHAGQTLGLKADGVITIFITDGNVGIKVSQPTLPLDVNAKSGVSLIGGFCIKLTNQTGLNTVAGGLVQSDPSNNDSFIYVLSSGDDCIGVILEGGVADGAEAWIVVGGIAYVLMDSGGSVRGDRLITSATAGRADVWNVGGAVATHFQEIGHSIETRIGAGLSKAILHFN